MKKLTLYYIKTYMFKNKVELLSSKYINCNIKLEVRCLICSHIYTVAWKNFQQGRRCPNCSFDRKRLSLKYIKKKTKEWSDGHECLAKKYINAHNKYKNKCKRGHVYETTWNNFKKGKRCPECYRLSIMGKNNIFWKGGVKEKNIPLYNTYAHKIEFCEEVRRDPKNKDYLQVKCTNSNCRKWFTPKTTDICRRLQAINGQFTKGAECNLYCSEECKNSCLIYRRKQYPKGFLKERNRDDNLHREWADLVKERDNYTCQKCGKKDLPLIAHHIEGLNVNPIESVDVDLGITLCSECDKKVHSEMGCRPIDLTEQQLCKGLI